jgi:hypothetical protein
MSWTEQAVRSRLQAVWAFENGLPASCHTFAEERLHLLRTSAAVDSGAMTAREASLQFDAITSRHIISAYDLVAQTEG